MPRTLPLGLVLVGACLSAGLAQASDPVVEVRDAEGNPVRDAVVSLVVERVATNFPPERMKADIVQIDQEFSPLVTVVPVGATVRFPNRDAVGHHVYSFSEPRKFDLPLYAGEEAPEIVFDQPGVVTLGCNIHDWMRAYVVVADSPWYAITGEDGRAVLRDLPEGSSSLRVWHPRLRGAPVTVALGEAGSEIVQAKLTLRPALRARRGSGGTRGGGYR